MSDTNPAEPSSSGQKRKRLSHACRACRARKVRCDERLPACSNCTKANVECITDDPRKPHLPLVKRTRASSTANNTAMEQPMELPVNLVNIATTSPPPTSASAPGTSDAGLNELRDDPKGTKFEAARNDSATSPWADPTWMRNALGSASASIISDSQAQDRFKYVGSSNLQVFSHWIDLVLAKQHVRRQSPHAAISDHFDHGRIHSEEYHFSLRPVLPALTHLRSFDTILDDFFNNTNSVFPVFDEGVLRCDAVRFIQQYRLNDAATMCLDLLPQYDVPLLAIIYIVTGLSLLDVMPQRKSQVKLYLDAAYSLYGHIIGVPYLSSVQALLLLHLALRAVSKDGAAWQALSSAIRIAYSIGLHRAPPSPPLHSAALERTKARIWWCCYALDRIATLDSGRPSMINDGDVQLLPPRPPRHSATVALNGDESSCKHQEMSDQTYQDRYMACLVSLCRLKSEIHSALYTSRNQSVEESQLFSTIASLDQKLMDWSTTCMHSLQLSTMSNEEGLRAVSRPRDLQTLHLICTYHFTVINVHRASVMLDTRLYQHHVASKLSRRRRDRMLSAETICRGSARAIIRSINQYRWLHHCSARMISGTIPLSAVYVLAICILKHPKEWNVSSDLALIDSIAKTVPRDYQGDGMPAEFTSIFTTLQKLALQCVKHSTSRPPSPPRGVEWEEERAQVSLEPLWKSLGFGHVLPGSDQHDTGVGLDGISPASTTAAPAPPAEAEAAASQDANNSFKSLLDLDQTDDLLRSLLGLPDFFSPVNEDAPTVMFQSSEALDPLPS